MELKQTDVWTSASQNFQWLKLSNNLLSFENACFFLQMSMLITFQVLNLPKLQMKNENFSQIKYSHNANSSKLCHIKSIGTEEIAST